MERNGKLQNVNLGENIYQNCLQVSLANARRLPSVLELGFITNIKMGFWRTKREEYKKRMRKNRRVNVRRGNERTRLLESKEVSGLLK